MIHSPQNKTMGRMPGYLPLRNQSRRNKWIRKILRTNSSIFEGEKKEDEKRTENCLFFDLKIKRNAEVLT
jgi:hypothetical protein